MYREDLVRPIVAPCNPPPWGTLAAVDLATGVVRFAGETLQGTFKGEGHVSLTRVADVRQVGCGAPAGGLPPAPPATGPRDRLTAAELLGRRCGHRSRPQCLLLARRPGRASPAPLQRDRDGQASTMFRARHGCAGLARPSLASRSPSSRMASIWCPSCATSCSPQAP